MTIRLINGNMFDATVEAIVNTVNCVGVMGKGVALEFKRRWPENYKAYKKACDAKILRPGKLLIFDNGNLFENASPRFLVNFPTKDHWKSKSKLEFIQWGLDALAEEITRLNIRSIAIPPLGCGNGGLEWDEVRPIITSKLEHLSEIAIEIYEPTKKDKSPEYKPVAQKMTVGRAVYLKALASIEPTFGGSIDRLSLQKIAYFLQILGVPLNLHFDDNLFGPYSDALKKALITFEKWDYISGLKEGERLAQVTSAGFAAAEDFLGTDDSSDEIVEKLLHLLNGFNSPYGLELLSTTHFYSKTAHTSLASTEVVSKVSMLKPHRRNHFAVPEILAAHSRLSDDGLLRSDAVQH